MYLSGYFLFTSASILFIFHNGSIYVTSLLAPKTYMPKRSDEQIKINTG